MSYMINNQQKLNDIIFAKRNKHYGAYAIRSTYGNTVFKSISFMLLGFGSFILTAYYLSNRNQPVDPLKNTGQTIDSSFIYSMEVNLPEPEPEKAEAKKNVTPPSTKPNETVLNEHTMVSDTVTEKKVTTEAVVQTSVATTNSTAGDGSDVNETGGGGSGTVTTLTKKDDVIPLHGVDSQPEFDGGLKALYGFVGSHLRYPDIASGQGRGGTVYVRFVVSETGQVTNLSLLNSIGFGMDEEALRVVALIPKFKTPAKVNGAPVKTYYQLPIKFSHRD